MKKFLTIVFAYYCSSEVRRSYLNACLKTLSDGIKNCKDEIKIFSLDGSPSSESRKNIDVFNLYFKDFEMIHINDQTENLIQRISNNLNVINTPYVLRLTEDCIYRCDNLLTNLKKDCQLLSKLPKCSVITYPYINTSNINIDGKKLIFSKPKMNQKNIESIQNVKFYNRNISHCHLNYSTSNFLYKSDFFDKHFTFFSKRSTNLYDTEADLLSFKFFPIRLQKFIHPSIRKRFIKFFFRNKSIQNIYITQNFVNFNPIHIGYESLVENDFSIEGSLNNDRNYSNKIEGKTTLNTLEKFKNFDWRNGFEIVISN